MEKPYEILEHTADGKFRAYGRTIEEAQTNAALAMVSLMWDWEKIRPELKEKVKVQASSLEQLIVKFLSEVIYLLEVRSFLLGRVEAMRIEEVKLNDKKLYRLEAELAGELISPNHEIYGQVKAVTYNDLKIEKTDDGLAIQVVVDM
jgi:SHS2 domain-containing protein